MCACVCARGTPAHCWVLLCTCVVCMSGRSEDKLRSWSSGAIHCFYFEGMRSLTGPEFAEWIRLAGQRTTSTHLSSFPGLRSQEPHSAQCSLFISSGTLTSGPRTSQVFYWLHSLQPSKNVFFFNTLNIQSFTFSLKKVVCIYFSAALSGIISSQSTLYNWIKFLKKCDQTYLIKTKNTVLKYLTVGKKIDISELLLF